MKKLTVILTAAMILTGLSAFGQGYFALSGGPGSIWNCWNSNFPAPGRGGPNRVAFLWGTGTPLVSSIMPFTPTNVFNEVPPSAWTAILTDPNFHLATNSSGGVIITQTNAANGGWAIAGTQPVLGTAPGAYQMYVVGWDAAYATPYEAAAAGAALGWSAVFNYNAVNNIGTPATLAQSGFAPFAVTAPEPTTCALAGLGAAVLWILRRRK